MITVIILVFLTTLIVLKYILHIRRIESYVKHIKALRKRPVLIGKTTTEIFRETIQTIKQNDTPYKNYIGPILLITLDKPDDIKAVLMSQNCLDKPYLYTFFPFSSAVVAEQCTKSINY